MLALCEAPRTIDEVSASMFGEQDGYGAILAAILAIDEAGAHVEHLHRLGRLREVAGRMRPEEPAVKYVAR